MANLSKQWAFIERAAREQGVGSEALRKWRERGRVPDRWRLPLWQAATAEKIKLDADIFDAPPDMGESQ